MNLGIFGGTFNPIHTGHITASLKFYDTARLEKLLVMPDRIPPHKSGAIASARDRLTMAKLVYGDKKIVGERCIEVSDMEINRSGKSYTYDTLCTVSEIFPGARLFLYAGSDMFYTLESWYKGAYILKMCTVVTANREKGEREKLSQYALHYKNTYGTDSIIMDYSPVIVSSTQIRQALSQKGAESFSDFTKNVLTESVRQYIMESNLYSD